MAIALRKNQTTPTTYPTGTQHAIIQGIIVLGTHTDERYGGERNRCVIRYELPDSQIEIEDNGVKQMVPQFISQIYTVTLNEKGNLYRVVKAACRTRLEELADDEDFFLHELIGKNLFITIDKKKTSEGKERYSVGSETSLLGAVQPKELHRESLMFANEPDEHGIIHLPDGLPEWMKEEILTSTEYREWDTERNSKIQAVQVKAAGELTPGLKPAPSSQTATTTQPDKPAANPPTIAPAGDAFDHIDLSGVPARLREAVLAEMRKAQKA